MINVTKKLFKVFIPLSFAIRDGVFAGSTPRIFLEKLEADSKKVPSFEPISNIKESLLILNLYQE